MTTPQLRELPNGGLAAYFDADGKMINDERVAVSVRVEYPDGRIVWGRRASTSEKRVVHLDAKYSDDQPRDENGRWTDAGGGGGGEGALHPSSNPQGQLGGAGVGPTKPAPPGVAERIERYETVVREHGLNVEATDAPYPHDDDAQIGAPHSDDHWDGTVKTAADELARLRNEHGLDINRVGGGAISLSRRDIDNPHTGGLTNINSVDNKSTIYLLNPTQAAAQFDQGPPAGQDVIHVAQAVRVGGRAVIVGETTIPTPGFSIAYQEARNADEYRASIFRHELGHALSASTKAMDYVADTFFTAKRGDLKKGVNPEVFKETWFPTHVSTYAGQHKMEALAEMFAAYTSPRYGQFGSGRLPKEWERVMDHMLGKDTKRSRARKEGVVYLERYVRTEKPVTLGKLDWSDPDDMADWVEDKGLRDNDDEQREEERD